MMIVLNGLDKILSHEGTGIECIGIQGEFNEREDFDSYVARVHRKCSFFSFKCLSVSMKVVATEENLT